MSYLFISYNILISWLWIFFLLRDSATQELLQLKHIVGLADQRAHASVFGCVLKAKY